MIESDHSLGAPGPLELGKASASAASPTEAGTNPINILIVDDEPKNLTVLQFILDDPDYRLVRAQSAEEALLALIAEQYALIILDVRMPGMTGFELAQMIKERKKTARVPIIFLTAYYSEDQHVLEAYGVGAVDYLQKPVNAAILRSKVAVFAELYRKNREAIFTSKALGAEVAERRRADEQLRELNETLENRVAARTSELAESRARLKHAADLAKLTYFDLDYVSNRVQVAENFARIMGFVLAGANDSDDPIAFAMGSLRERVVHADRERFARESEWSGTGKARKIEYRLFGEDGKERWIESEWHVENDPNGKPLRAFAANLNITERKRSEEHKRLLMAEVNHRSRNLLAVVQAIVNQSARGADPTTFAVNLADRLQGLSASQDLLIKSDWHGIDIHELIPAQLHHFNDLIGTRIFVEGPTAHLTSASAQAVGMALHELATNAAKYGSLSASDGSVRISWDYSEGIEKLFTMRWTEENGPKMPVPNRKGFGSLVTGPMVESALGGKVEIEFLKAGLSWKLSAPVAEVLEKR
jgi:two-component sensor histidine kinase/AmiR/NasT family two-component response regulator